MPSSYTVNLGIEKIATGEQSGTWGDTTNVNFDIIDQAVNGAASVTLASAGTSGSPNTLAITDGATSDGRNKFIEFTDGGDLGATAYVQLTPNDAEKIVFIRNSLSGSRSVILFQGTYNAARDVEVPAGVDMIVKFQGGGTVSTVQNVMQRLQTETLSVTGNADVGAGLDVTGNITVTGTVDGRDVAADGTKLDTVETNADVTDTANVTAAGALMDSELTNITAVKALNQGVATTDSPSFAGLTINTSGYVKLLADDGADTPFSVGAGTNAVTVSNNTLATTDDEYVTLSQNDSTVRIGAGGSEAMRINSSGYVGIGTSSPSYKLDVNGSFNSESLTTVGEGIDVTRGDGNAFAVRVNAANSQAFVYCADGGHYFKDLAETTTWMTITSGGDLNVDSGTLFVDASANRVGIGTSSPDQDLHIADNFPVFRLQDTDGTDQYADIIHSAGNTNIDCRDGASNGSIRFRGAGGGSTTEYARFTSSGALGIGTTSPSSKLDVAGDTTVNGNFFATGVQTATSALAANVRVLTGGQLVRSTSSLKYKHNVEDADLALSEAVVYGSRPVWYQSLSDLDNDAWGFWGFIAEELHEVDPRLVDYAEAENGDLTPDGVQYDRFTVHLVNVAQQQKARIDDLEARLAALEAKL